MNALVELWEKPVAEEIYLIAGWHQWADAGNISSGLPQYLIEQTQARRIGQIKPGDFYLFQVPGTHHFLRPQVKLKEGHVEKLESRSNEFFYSEQGSTGLVVFLGQEPHLNVDGYAGAFLDAVEALGVRRVIAMGGVYGAMPYDRERSISCTYSLPGLKAELGDYAVRLSDYEGGSTIGTYLVKRAEERGIEFVAFYGFVPAYDFSELSSLVQGMRIENDYKAWHELMRRLNHMLGLGLDLSDLLQQSDDLVASMAAKVEELDRKMPQLNVRDYLDRLSEDFTERPFLPLDDIWEEELGDILGGLEG